MIYSVLYKKDFYQICLTTLTTNNKSNESMKNPETRLIEYFYQVDDFNKVFIDQLQTPVSPILRKYFSRVAQLM